MPTIGGTGNTLQSLSAIDKWIKTINSSIAGAAVTGFKKQDITFGGSTTESILSPQGGALGIQFAEQSLTVGGTSSDFSEGQVVASTQAQHFAISGSEKAFFTLSDNIIDNSGAIPAGTNFYYSRGGEFHFDSSGRLRTPEGLYVMGKDDGGNDSTLRFQELNGGGPVAGTIDLAGRSLDEAMADLAENHNTNNVGAGAISHAIIQDVQSLRFSKFGSHIWNDNDPPIDITADLFIADAANAESSKVTMNFASLEASNVQLPTELVALALAEKLYSALTKVIQTEQNKIDQLLRISG